jgi:hypothetical protein
MTLLTSARTVAVAGLFGLAMAGAATTPASAYSYSRCDADGYCYRVHCDYDGDNCYRTYDRQYSYDVRPARHWVCDADGDNCHWSSYDYDRHYYDYNRDYYGPY